MIVVLDADPRSRALLEEILAADRYRVSSTGDTQEAVRIARTEEADIVLADMGMGVLEAVPRWQRRRSDPDPQGPLPVSQGYAVLRGLHQHPGAARCPAVYLRENWSGDAHAYRFGVVGYLPKPLDATLVRTRIGSLFHDMEPDVEAATPAVEEPVAVVAEAAPPLSVEATNLRGETLPSPPPPAPAIEALPPGLRTCLVVDGEPQARRFLRGVLEAYSFKVFEADEGEAGLKLAIAKRPWLILSEVNMSGMDGFEFCRRVRRQAVTRHTPLIFISAWDDYRERQLGLKLGADDYLSKSASLRELLIRVQLILKRYSDVGTRTRKGAGLEGSIDLIGAPGLLQMCHLGRFSGNCTVRTDSKRMQIGFREGEIVTAAGEGASGAGAVYEFLSWAEGHFEFVPAVVQTEEAELRESFDYLLLEGCRRLDEQRRLAEADTQIAPPEGERRTQSA
jgi:DNA-binding response OmpR family regulator